MKFGHVRTTRFPSHRYISTSIITPFISTNIHKQTGRRTPLSPNGNFGLFRSPLSTPNRWESRRISERGACPGGRRERRVSGEWRRSQRTYPHVSVTNNRQKSERKRNRRSDPAYSIVVDRGRSTPAKRRHWQLWSFRHPRWGENERSISKRVCQGG